MRREAGEAGMRLYERPPGPTFLACAALTAPLAFRRRAMNYTGQELRHASRELTALAQFVAGKVA